MAPRASTSQDSKRKSGTKRPSVKEQMDARLLSERQAASRKAFQQKFRAAFAAPPSGARVAEVRGEGFGNISKSTFSSQSQGGAFVYFLAYDKEGNPTGEEWDASYQGLDDLRPREFRQAGASIKRARSPSDNESAGSDGEVSTGVGSDVEVSEAPATSSKGKGKAKAADDAEKLPAPASSTPRKPRRAPAPKRARRTPVKQPAQDLDDASAELDATAASPRGRVNNREPSEPPVASTSGSASPAAGASSSEAAGSEAGPSSSTAAGPAAQSEGIFGRGRRVTRGLYGRTAISPARDFGPAFAAAPEGVAFSYDTPAFRMSPRKPPPSIGGESALERLCSRVDDLDVEGSAPSMILDTDTECGTPAPEGDAGVDDTENDREATPVAPVASSSPVTRSAAKGKARAL